MLRCLEQLLPAIYTKEEARKAKKEIFPEDDLETLATNPDRYREIRDAVNKQLGNVIRIAPEWAVAALDVEVQILLGFQQVPHLDGVIAKEEDQAPVSTEGGPVRNRFFRRCNEFV